MPDGQTRRMGGPVDPRQRVFLHNVADLPSATRVIEGVYYGGDIEEAKSREGARVEAFYGYAAWFDGQLDGEIRNADWTWTNEASADLVFPPMENAAEEKSNRAVGDQKSGGGKAEKRNDVP
mmetsp:Transcript_4530/g.8848  ORF Transcript_4530/g.8848 Transcript_4530/m.8848 type:complete len:122 (-) Transcript_4530:254-619(-)